MIILNDYDGKEAKPINVGEYLVLLKDDHEEVYWGIAYYANEWRNISDEVVRWAKLPNGEDYE